MNEKSLIFNYGHPPMEGHVVDLLGEYWTVLRYEPDPDAVWEVFDYEFLEARPKTIRVVMRPATAMEIEGNRPRGKVKYSKEQLDRVVQAWNDNP